MTHNDVLLVSEMHDFTTDAIILELRRRGKRPGRIGIAEMVNGRYAISISDQSVKTTIQAGNSMFDLIHLDSAYWRLSSLSTEEAYSALCASPGSRRECDFSLQAIWDIIGDRWIDNPRLVIGAELYTEQLSRAKRAGFTTPETLIGSDREAISTFITAARGAVDFVMFGSNPVMTRIGMISRDPSPMEALLGRQRFIISDSNKFIDTIGKMPSCLQKSVPLNKVHLVYLVGNSVFCSRCRISSGGNQWALEECELPSFLIESCLEIRRISGLKIASVYIADASDKEFVFLRIDPLGSAYELGAAISSYRVVPTICDLICPVEK